MDIPSLDHREQHFFIPGPHAPLNLFLRYLPATQVIANSSHSSHIVLYVHGASFPSALSIAHRFDGHSWRDELNAAGFDVWGLDFQGFGFSDRYPEMDAPAKLNPALCNTADATEQLHCCVQFILSHHAASRLSIIAHSWGSIPTCRLASIYPTLIDRLVLFGPIARRGPRRYEVAPTATAWGLVTIENQWKRFVEDVPPGVVPVLSQVHFDDWAEHYLDSDPGSRLRDPASVMVPSGPVNDILRAWHGQLGYEPAMVRAPVALIRGEWDGLIPDQDARWLFDAFTASPNKRDIKISGGTHLMHLEAMRFALYRESISFLHGGDLPPDLSPAKGTS
ncbi:alpha/beta hydrolase [Solimicrobium silvestre]|uniref:Alpha/beta hydrolase family n=1 Tax=Solimicrobium silvestre TaxID=2099400 RepID=A0A2S9GTM6_9BURK|nr:alpha/beta fold hydrolase [Solimicrobium silvestre]PRC91067.1 Alpha/beta hydrolase family [Solimicrobium silvestre]